MLARMQVGVGRLQIYGKASLSEEQVQHLRDISKLQLTHGQHAQAQGTALDWRVEPKHKTVLKLQHDILMYNAEHDTFVLKPGITEEHKLAGAFSAHRQVAHG